MRPIFHRADALAGGFAIGLHGLLADCLWLAPAKRDRDVERVDLVLTAPATRASKPSVAESRTKPRANPFGARATAKSIASAAPRLEAHEVTDDATSTVAVPRGDGGGSEPNGPAEARGGKARGTGTDERGAPLPPPPPVTMKRQPLIDGDACARTVTYPTEAEQLGIEGDVKLRVSLDEHGRVVGVKVLSGLGHGLDQAAVFALQHRCSFTPAMGSDGKPMAYVIETYTWSFELPR